MPDIKRAVDAVIQHLSSLGRLLPSGEPRLEEFQYDSEYGEWTLTFSFDDAFGTQRLYRVFKVDDSDRVLSMRIREPALPF